MKGWSRATVLLGALSAGACSDSGAGPAADLYTLRILDGDNQTGLVGSALPEPLRVEIRELGSGALASGVPVQWTVSSGSGAMLPQPSTVTDGLGVASASLVLGPAEGEVRVTARADGAGGSAGFRAFAASSPTLDAVVGALVAGATVRLQGTGFLPDTEVHRVTFSGIHGDVISVAPGELSVKVPGCLPSRSVDVRAFVEERPSNSVSAWVTSSGPGVRLAVGEDLLLAGTEALRCRRLEVENGEEYVLVPQAVSTSTATPFPYRVIGLAPTAEPLTVAGVPERARDEVPGGMLPELSVGVMDHDAIRRLEAARETGNGDVTQGSRRVTMPSDDVRVPSLGDTTSVHVLDGMGGLVEVFGTLRMLTESTEVYVDVTAPVPGYTDQDLMTIVSEFDDTVRPTVERAYGAASDLDGNGRVTIMFTPAVNRLSPRGSGTLIAGFFFAADLSPQDGSAPAERFYAAVPDPAGVHADPLDRDLLTRAIPAVLAHEFQHMVHYNRRMLLGGADRVEALWLQEALAQMAEDVVAQELDAAGAPGRAALFRAGNLDRAQRYLAETGRVSLTVTSGIGTLAERGGGWLFVRYLFDHLGGEGLLRRMTESTHLGSETVVAATGESWPRTFSDFALAVFLDDIGAPLPVRFGYLGMDLRTDLAGVNDGYPLHPERLAGATFSRAGTLRSASAGYYVLAPAVGTDLAVTFVGTDGMPPSPESDLQVRMVRYR